MDDEQIISTIQSKNTDDQGASAAQSLSTADQGASVVQSTVTSIGAGGPEGSLLEASLLENLALSSVESMSTVGATTEDTLLGQSDTDMDSPEARRPEPQPKKRLLGAARRHLKKQKQEELAQQAQGSQVTGAAVSAAPSQDQPSATATASMTSGTASAAQTKSGESKKRPIHTGDTPEGEKPVEKKTRLDYAQVASRSLQVSIACTENPERQITEGEMLHIRQKLVELIDLMPRTSQAPRPQFLKSGLVQGVYRITCKDQTSLNWLKVSVPRVEPFEGRCYQVMDLPEHLRPAKVRVWIPGRPSRPQDVLQRLAFQNPGLNSTGWRLLHRQVKAEGQLLVLGVSQESLKKIKDLKGRAFLELSQVTFEIPGQGQVGSSDKRTGAGPSH